MTLLQPIWLLLLIPLAVAWRRWPLPTRALQTLRATAYVCVVLAACGLSLRLPSRAGTVVVVADRSRSMPAGSDAAHREMISVIQKAMSGEERLAVVSFGEAAAIERAPQPGPFAGFVADVGPDASNLAEGLEKGLSLIPPDAPGRIVVISDGRAGGRDPAAGAAQAAARGVAVDYRLLERSSVNDTAISRIDAPAAVTPGERYLLTAWIRSPVRQDVAYEVSCDGRPIAAGNAAMVSGLNRLTFRDASDGPGTRRYLIRVTGANDDPSPENNVAKVLVGVSGPRPLLCVSPTSASGLARLLAAGGLAVVAKTPDACEWSLDELTKYSGVVLENVPAEKIGVRGMENLAAWVRETGSGLLMTGGKNAYAPGGYFKSPLEPIMPVSMELRQEHRKLALSIVVAMDRSGSMAAPAGGGRPKMDLANLAAAQVLDLLTPLDEFGCIAVDSSPHVVADLAPVENKDAVRGRILRVQSEGGGIFIFEALASASNMLLKAKAETRHIILFADAADSEEPGRYKELLEKCARANMTVSVVGLGKPTDADAELLRDIARRGDGRCYFTESAEELPRLFAQDTFIVARSAFLDQPTPFQFTGGVVTLTGRQFSAAPALGGYNLCYVRPNANLAAVTQDEYAAPVVAAWQVGLGRTACYTGEADGQFTGAMAGWTSVGDFFSSLGRWTAGASQNLSGDLLASQNVQNGVCVVQLDLDPARTADPFTGTPQVTTLRSRPGAPPSGVTAAMRWISADSLAVEVPLRGEETAISTVAAPGVGAISLPPVTAPYSPEFAPVEGDAGAALLERLARATGGAERTDLAGVWKTLPKRARLIDLAAWLALLAVVSLTAEVLERRTGLISTIRTPPRGLLNWRAPTPARPAAPPPGGDRAPEATLGAEAPSAPSVPPANAPPSAPSTAMQDALRQARQQAQDRLKRG
jgi:Mg-chelatase subunit ChlD